MPKARSKRKGNNNSFAKSSTRESDNNSNPFKKAFSADNKKDKWNRSDSESLSRLKAANPFKSELFAPKEVLSQPFVKKQPPPIEIAKKEEPKVLSELGKANDSTNNNRKLRNNSNKLKYLRKELAKIGVTRRFVDLFLKNGIKSIDDVQKPGIGDAILSKAANEEEKAAITNALNNLRTFAALRKLTPSSIAVSKTLAASKISIREAAKMKNKELAKILRNVPEEGKDEVVKTIGARMRAADIVLANELVDARTRYMSSAAAHYDGRRDTSTAATGTAGASTASAATGTTTTTSSTAAAATVAAADSSLGASAAAASAIAASEQPPCDCPECMTAVSPLAYLADLIDFATKMLKENVSTSVNIVRLESLLKQPFSSLPAQCAQVSKSELTSRLATEVLLRYFSINLDNIAAAPPAATNPNLKKAESDYRLRAYIELLSRIGTTYEEIRAARLFNDENNPDHLKELKRLADRIGVDVKVKDADDNETLFVKELFKPPDQITRDWLELTFGLVDVNVLKRNPLLYGPVAAYGNGRDQLSNWDLNGVKIGWNTDNLGRMYADIEYTPFVGGGTTELHDEVTITLYRDNTRQKKVASGTISFVVGTPAAAMKGTVALQAFQDSGLKGSVYLTYNNVESDTIVLEVVPRILVWRLQHLRSLWKMLDWPQERQKQQQDDSLTGVPIIEPDIIGPDDLRNPVPLANAGEPVKAFDIWLKRRNWIDDRLKEFANTVKAGDSTTPDLKKMFKDMYENDVTYDTVTKRIWANTTPVSEFESLATQLSRGEDVDTIKGKLKNDLQLTVDRFNRLIGIYRKDKLATADTRNEKVTRDEWLELFSILAQCQKEKFYTEWTDEEKTNNIYLDLQQFWIPVREPKDGQWPPADVVVYAPPTPEEQKIPLLDPDTVNIDDLPDQYVVGSRAIQIWNTRKDELEQIHKDLRELRETNNYNIVNLLKSALGLNPEDSLPNNVDLDVLDANIKNGVDLDNTKKAIEEDLHMGTVDNFTRFMAIKAKEENADPLKKPTIAEYEEVYSILTQVQKQKQEYPQWIEEENNNAASLGPLYYWQAYKAKLPLWRSSRSARQMWQQLLTNNNSQPIIDIDIIDEYDLRAPYAEDAAYDLWLTRNKTRSDYIEGDAAPTPPAADGIKKKLNDAIAALSGNPNEVDDFLAKELGFLSREELKLLADQRKEGKNIQPRLKQLGIDVVGWFDRIVSLKAIATTLLQEEKDDIIEILWQSYKRVNLFGLWRREEYKDGQNSILLSPDYFQDRNNMPLADAMGKMSNNQQQNRRSRRPKITLLLPSSIRLDWEDKLYQRIDQDSQMHSSLGDILKAADANSMPVLRDALVMMEQLVIAGTANTTADPNELLSRKSKQLSNKLSVDFSTGPTISSTRIALAIESLQGLMTAVRNRTIEQYTDLKNLIIEPGEEDEFDQSWVWIGSYATWRAAMFVFLYPENIMLPNFHKKSSKAFREMVSKTRSLRRLTPSDTEDVALEYAKYLRDISNIQLHCSAMAEVPKRMVQCRTRHDFNVDDVEAMEQEDKEDRIFLFGIGPETRQIYWMSFPSNPDTHDGRGYTVWNPVPGIEGDVEKVIGAAIFKPYKGEYIDSSGASKKVYTGGRYLYLFFRQNEKGEAMLRYTKYDLSTPSTSLQEGWSGKVEDLKLPTDESTSSSSSSEDQKKEEAKGPSDFIAQVVQNFHYGELNRHIHIVLMTTSGLYIRSMNSEGTDWMDGEWQQYRLTDLPMLILGVWAAIGLPDGGICMIGLIGELQLTTRSFGRFGLGGRTFSLPTGITLGPVKQRYRVFGGNRPTNGWVSFNLPHMNSANRLRGYRGAAVYPGQYTIDVLFGADAVRLDLRNGSQTVFTAPAGLGKLVPLCGRHPGNIKYEAPLWRRAVGARGSTGVFVYTLEQAFVNGQQPTISRVGFWKANPTIRRNVAISPCYMQEELPKRAEDIKLNYEANDVPEYRTNLHYLFEAYYAVPVHLFLQLQRSGHYIDALDWMRTVYDYSTKKKIWYGLVKDTDASTSSSFDRIEEWLLDPLDPHSIAENRHGSYTRYTLMSLVGGLLAYADNEFTLDTAESVPRARELYQTALDILELPDMQQGIRTSCPNVIGNVMTITIEEEIEKAGPSIKGEWVNTVRLVNWIADGVIRLKAENDVAAIMARKEEPIQDRVAKAKAVVEEALEESNAKAVQPAAEDLTTASRSSLKLGTILKRREAAIKRVEPSLVLASGDAVTKAAEVAVNIVSSSSSSGGAAMMLMEEGTTTTAVAATATDDARAVRRNNNKRFTIPPLVFSSSLSFDFCIPSNPVPTALKMRAMTNLEKIHSGRNIAGMLRTLDPYAAPTDATTGMPYIGAGGNLVLPGIGTIVQSLYRFDFLIQRSRDLVALSGQVESAFLSALEKRDAEYFSIFKAKQDIKLARAEVRLQDLRVNEAQDGVQLARLQRDRAQIQSDYFQELIDGGVSALETQALTLMGISAYLSIEASIVSFVAAALPSSVGITGPSFSPQGSASAAASGLGSLASAASTTASIFSTLASYERRAREWQYNLDLAKQDIRIGDQGIRIAEDRVKIVEQERNISMLKTEHAEATVDFLSNKFTNVELYDWMSGVLEEVYGSLLQHATAMAQLAQSQLSFERQKTVPSFIHGDYWSAPTDDALAALSGDNNGGNNTSRNNERRGLTGSSRLLADIIELEQYHIDTEQRKRQLTRTFSLARLAPIEFQKLRDTGLMTFRTTLDMFDRDFPGHYLRVIKGVKVTVVALVPSTEGIRATLTCAGSSIVVQKANYMFQKVRVVRPPESIDLTSPRDATGMFDMQMQPNMLRPFEGTGVETMWELKMPKAANPFDYDTISDVLITIEYTSLYDADYAEQVKDNLPETIEANRVFSFRNHLPDLWYELHNYHMDGSNNSVTLSFNTSRADFPPNLTDLRISGVSLFIAGGAGRTIQIGDLRFIQENTPGNGIGGGAQASQVDDGIISTSKGNAAAWTAISGRPFGRWILKITQPQTLELLRSDDVKDVVFVLSVKGRVTAGGWL